MGRPGPGDSPQSGAQVPCQSSLVIASLILLASLCEGRPAQAAEQTFAFAPMPEFPVAGADSWLNSPPLTLKDLRGRVVVIELWAAACVNCLRSFAWVRELEARYGPSGLRVLGVHTPELPIERRRDQVESVAQRFGMRHPILLDNDYVYWTRLSNQYWPRFYLVDRRGRIRRVYEGEMNIDTFFSDEAEAILKELLAESPYARLLPIAPPSQRGVNDDVRCVQVPDPIDACHLVPDGRGFHAARPTCGDAGISGCAARPLAELQAAQAE